LRRLQLVDGPQLRWAFDAGMERYLSGVGAGELGFDALGKQKIDKLSRHIWMRRAGDQHRSIGHEKTADAVGSLVGIHKLDRLVLANTAHHVIAVD
jgi:hypothetical protein